MFRLMIKQLELVQLNDWFTTIHFKDAYFHIHMKHRKILHFTFQWVDYK